MVEKATRRDTLAAAATGLLAGAVGPMRIAQAEQAAPGSADQAAHPQQASFAQVTQPANGVIMPEGYVRAAAQFAYLWGWSLRNMANRRAAITQAPAPGLIGGFESGL